MYNYIGEFDRPVQENFPRLQNNTMAAAPGAMFGGVGGGGASDPQALNPLLV